MRSMHPIASLVLPALAGTLLMGAEPILIQPAKAEQTTEVRVVPLASGATLKVKNVNGRIHVMVWDKEQVEFTGAFKPSSQKEQVKVRIETTAKGLEIIGEYPKHATHWGSDQGPQCQMDLKVPSRVLPCLETVNGEVELLGTSGDADLSSVNGGIAVHDLKGALKGQTVNGAISLDQIRGGLKLETVNGSIQGKGLDGQGQGIDISAVNGQIQLQMGGLKGRLHAATVNGSLSFKAPGAQQVEDNRKSLSAVFPGSDQKISLSTVNGSISVE